MRLNSGPLGDHNVRLFLGVTLVVGFGSSALALVAPVWVFTLTGSASLGALTGLCVYAPSLAGPLIGTVVDRLPRRSTLLTTNIAMAAVLLVLLAVRSVADVWLVYVVMLAYGASLVLVDAAESAVVGTVVAPRWLGRVNSLRMSLQEGLKLVAPLAGAALFTAIGGGAVAAVAAVALLVGAGLYAGLRWPSPAPPRPVRTGVRRETLEGLAQLFAPGPVRAVVLAASAVMAISGLATAAALLVITEGLHRPPAFAGVLGAAQGAGSIVGGFLCGRLLDRRGEPVTAAVGALLFAVGTVALAVPSTAVVLAARFVGGVGLPWTVVAAFTAVQRHTRGALIGRVAASAGTLVFGPVALAIPVGAGLITVVDYRLVLAGSALAAAATAIALAAARSGSADAPTDADATPEPTVEPTPASA